MLAGAWPPIASGWSGCGREGPCFIECKKTLSSAVAPFTQMLPQLWALSSYCKQQKDAARNKREQTDPSLPPLNAALHGTTSIDVGDEWARCRAGRSDINVLNLRSLLISFSHPFTATRESHPLSRLLHEP